MNLSALVKAAERRLKRIERTLAFDLLRGDERRADKRRYRQYAKVAVGDYVAAGEEIELHRSVLYWKSAYNWDDESPSTWNEWTCVPVDRIGPDCVRVFLPRRGSHPIPVGDFVRAVVRGHVREPVNTTPTTGVEGCSPCSSS